MSTTTKPNYPIGMQLRLALPALTVALGLFLMAFGSRADSDALFWFGVTGAGFGGLRLIGRLRNRCNVRSAWVRFNDWRSLRSVPHDASDSPRAEETPTGPSEPEPKTEEPIPTDITSLVERMLSEGRYTLLLRPQIAGNLTPELTAAAREILEQRMSQVPAGEALLEQHPFSAPLDPRADPSTQQISTTVVPVEALFLDRTTVTNEQFHVFVAAGGYEQSSLWDEAVRPALAEFVDSTGYLGPRFWRNGRYPAGEGRHPVTGVSWYEAAAFARWVGKRLPSDPEWVKAASWPISLSPTSRAYRKYPWGDSMDHQLANLWSSGLHRTVPADDRAEGATVGGVLQMVGNVWEWTADDFVLQPAGPQPTDPPLLKTIRGGAYDTYFDSQATCQFSSGETPLARKHNIGFRCAVGACDLVQEPEPISGSMFDDDLPQSDDTLDEMPELVDDDQGLTPDEVNA